jgi:hypothetical protein
MWLERFTDSSTDANPQLTTDSRSGTAASESQSDHCECHHFADIRD